MTVCIETCRSSTPHISQVAKDDPTGGTRVSMNAPERMELNVSTTFVELVLTTMSMWSREGAQVLSQARGSYAPYKIRNRTGSPIFVWSDVDGSANGAKDVNAVKIANEETVDWRFDDWKTMREVNKSGSLLSRY